MAEDLDARVHMCVKRRPKDSHILTRSFTVRRRKEYRLRHTMEALFYHEEKGVMLKKKTDEKRCVTVNDARKLRNYGGKLSVLWAINNTEALAVQRTRTPHCFHLMFIH